MDGFITKPEKEAAGVKFSDFFVGLLYTKSLFTI